MQANGRLSKLWVRAAVFNTFISEVIMNQEIKDLEKMEELEAFKIKLNDLWEGVK